MNEFDLIKRLTGSLPKKKGALKQGIGDDCAVFKVGRENYLCTTDMLVESVHFKREWTTPYLLGRKILSVNLSDIAAMGGEPLYAVVAAAFPKKTTLPYLKELYRGLKAVANRHKVLLIGGDTNASPGPMVFCVTLLGRSKVSPILRSGAKVGDDIYVTGPLGRSALGLEVLKKGRGGSKTRPYRQFRPYIKSHLDPTPKVKVGQWLAQQKIAHSMIDLSDGLLSDLSHILKASRVGAHLEWDKIPLTRNFSSLTKRLGLSAQRLALTGGEDYELLFTASRSYRRQLKNFHRIGVVVKGYEIIHVFNSRKEVIHLPTLGYNHFSSHAR
ncbi:MAG: thiamine-phosphate kinase [Deltaproteobacteria bacterium]|nr:thiamine-phosphate kinase [Deltaproteobacteria bacterium]